MTLTMDAPALDDVTVIPSIALDIDTWLRTQVQPEVPVRWKRKGGGRGTVKDAQHLAELVAGLGAVGDFGIVEREGVGWGQTMNVGSGFIVEVNGIPGPECFTRRVVSTFGEGGEIIGSASSAAMVLWSWMRTGLPGGYILRQFDGEG